MSRRAVDALLALAGLVLAIGLGEIVLWGLDLDYRPLQIEDMTLGRDDRRQHIFNDSDFVSDPDSIWKPRAGVGVFNAQGYRGRALRTPPPPGQLRVLTVGDSNTLGWYGDTGPNWPEDLERLLAETHPRAAVANGGVWGYTSFQGVRRLRDLLELAPDIVLVSFGSNDAHRVRLSDAEFAQGALRRSLLLRPLQWLRSGRLLLSQFDRRAMRGDRPLRPRVSPEQYADNLEAMVRMSRARGADVFLLTRPYIGVSGDPNWWKNFAATYHEVTISVANSEDVPVIDVYSHFRERNQLFADESHFNDAGHEAAARLIHERLKPTVVERTIDRGPGAGP